MMDERNPELMPIGTFARAAQLSIKALRLYDRRQLLRPAWVDPENGYRYYHRDQITPARLVRLMRQMDMPMADIRKVLAARPNEAVLFVQDYQQSFAEHARQVQAIAQLVVAHLGQEVKSMAFQVEQCYIPAQYVASIRRRVHVQQLDSFITGSLKQLQAFVTGQNGQIVGPPFGIYHGPVNSDDDGPIEVCLPIGEPLSATEGITVRQMPACDAAVVTARGAQCNFPAILEAYDAACDWIVARGLETSGPAREIWLHGPGPEAEMQIAWPFRSQK